MADRRGRTDVLVVDDDPADVELIVRSLAGEVPADRIEIARDGDEALRFLQGRPAGRRRDLAPPPRLVLLDLELPRVHGFEVLRAMRDDPRLAMTPVVVLTAGEDGIDVERSYRLGANSCVRKPVDYRAFTAAIRGVAAYWLGLNQPARRDNLA